MPANTLMTFSPIVRLAEDVEDKIYNFRPSDTPLTSSIDRVPVEAVFHEWTADTYRAPVLTNAAIEGADAAYVVPAQPITYGNRTQIFQDTVSVSGTAERVKKYGRKSEATRLKTKKMIEVKKDIEASAIGNPVSVTGTGVAGGRMRGLFGWVATNDEVVGTSPDPINNVAPVAGALRAVTAPLVNSIIRQTYENGGDCEVLMVTPQHKVQISTFAQNVQRTNEVGGANKGINTLLQTSFGVYGHDFGQTKVVPNRVMPFAGAGGVNTVYLLDYDKVKLGQLRPFQSKRLAEVGDSEQHQILTEVTLVVPQESTLGAVRDVTATGA